jgi:hypothetical protein
MTYNCCQFYGDGDPWPTMFGWTERYAFYRWQVHLIHGSGRRIVYRTQLLGLLMYCEAHGDKRNRSVT